MYSPTCYSPSLCGSGKTTVLWEESALYRLASGSARAGRTRRERVASHAIRNCDVINIYSVTHHPGAVEKVVDGVKGVNAGDSSVLEAEQDVSPVDGRVANVLTDEHEVGFERSDEGSVWNGNMYCTKRHVCSCMFAPHNPRPVASHLDVHNGSLVGVSCQVDLTKLCLNRNNKTTLVLNLNAF